MMSQNEVMTTSARTWIQSHSQQWHFRADTKYHAAMTQRPCSYILRLSDSSLPPLQNDEKAAARVI